MMMMEDQDQMGVEMVLCPSKLPTGIVLPAKHYVTKKPNRVKVGRVPISRTAQRTIKQPIYLRQGNGIFLRKYQCPRREKYGDEMWPPKRLIYYSSSVGDYSGTLNRVLFTPGVIMTNQPICVHHLDPQFDTLKQALAKTPPFTQEQKEAIEDELDRMPDMQRIVHREPAAPHVTKIVQTMTSEPPVYFDQEGRGKRPPKYFIPLPPLPKPEICYEDWSTGSSSVYFLQAPRLRRPESPIIQIRSSKLSPSEENNIEEEGRVGGGEEEGEEEEEEKGTAEWRRGRRSAMVITDSEDLMIRRRSRLRERHYEPLMYVPRVKVASSGGGGGGGALLNHVKVTSSRVQEWWVALGDMFPCKAEKGLLAEIDFYQKNNFPLLMARNPDVDLEAFTSINPTRMLPLERVAKVAALSRKVSRQRAQTQELKDEDSDIEDEGSTLLEDKVLNPLSYPFNKELYKGIHKLTKANKL